MKDSEFMTVDEAVRLRRCSEGALFEHGISGALSFYVYVPGQELCRVPVEALQCFKAGGDECEAAGMLQRYGDKLSGRWVVKRGQLRLERNTDHDILRLLAPILSPQAPHAEPVEAVPAVGAEWVSRAQDRAREIIARQAARELHPSQQAIADEIAGEFRAAGVAGAKGKPLTGSYIKRHALKGIASAMPQTAFHGK